MSRGYKLLLFYAVALLAVADVCALVGRLFLVAPDPVAWEKVALSAMLQGIAITIAAYYLRWLSRTKHPLIPERRSLLTLNLALAPIIAVGLIAALSIAVLTNATNCGNHPLPVHRGEKTCPR